MCRSFNLVLIGMAILLLGPSQARPDVIVQSFDGAGPAWSMGSGQITIPAGSNPISFVNGASSSSLTASFPATLTVNPTPTVNGVQLIYSVTSGPFNFSISDGTHTDTFKFTPAMLTTSTGPPGNANAATIIGGLQLTSGNNIPGFDFSSYATVNGPNFLFGINTSASGGFPALFSNPSATGVGTGSFSSNAGGLAAAVPEPTSLIVVSAALFGGGFVWIRRRRNVRVG